MRRFASISLLFLYLLCSAGLVVSLHYCGNSLASAGLFDKASCCCDDEESGTPDDCCKDEVKTLKLSTDQIKHDEVLGWKSALLGDAVFPVLTASSYSLSPLQTLDAQPSHLPRPPDRYAAHPAYLLHHALLFYA
jgi:hypothetical protein